MEETNSITMQHLQFYLLNHGGTVLMEQLPIGEFKVAFIGMNLIKEPNEFWQTLTLDFYCTDEEFESIHQRLKEKNQEIHYVREEEINTDMILVNNFPFVFWKRDFPDYRCSIDRVED